MCIVVPPKVEELGKIDYLKYISSLLDSIKSEISDKFTTNDHLVDMTTEFIGKRIAFVQDAIQESIREIKRYEMEKQSHKAN